ncbi:MAG: Eco57I restriction-modification methylase domain-containing protein [Helicobacteraceae bacterium]|nr:Eco57I restriction-modification methylase domain-containing protein [Helicobacteraceae bacterium]
MKSDVESKSLSFKKLTINSFLNPLYNRIKNSDRRNNFENAKKQYLLNLQMHKEENEDHLVANVLAQFLRNLDFEVKVKSKQKGKSEIDLVILKDSNIEVIIEAKKPNNRDFISTNINSKALHEAILYYFREREKQNSSIKHIIITDFYRFFIFEAKEFERLFYKNKSFKKLYENFISNSSLFEGNTKEFYSEISKILDSQEYQNEALNGLDIDIKSTDSNLYKVFHRDFLLNEFNPNDANTLNQNFYNELLYILGLCEKSINGKILLKPSDQTLGAKGTLYYNIFNNLAESKKDLESFKNGEIDENILEILIIWINRILFLKLLESNLINFNNDKNLSFLNKEKIPNYIILNDLFFKILARKIEDRDDSNPTLAYLPYLNSSLFSKDSKEFIEIRTLSDLELEYFSNTQIKDIHAKQKQGKQKWLYYLFEFLDAFDFGVIEGDLKVESSIDSLTNTPPHLEQKPLINSSVLGLVFEKLNGYKEGSFYTPSFITSYMCKESLNKIVLAKFNTLNPDWNAKNLDNIAEEIQAQIRSNRDKSQEIKESYKNLLDSIRICDPAVGSGHFLVSTLNELIYIHHYLGLFLSDCEVSLINDELFIKDSAGEVFSYKRPKKENKNHQIQKELFALKKSIIENNLFGVDINPNSVNICRLRLWIELLKNSYYLNFAKDEDSKIHKLQTLPNIDINIKDGNSLVSYFDIQANLAHYPNIGTKMQDYKRVVQNYKEGFYQDKLQIDEQIKDLLQAFKIFCFKDKFKKEIKSFDIKCEEYSKKYGNYLAKDDNDLSLYVQQRLFVGEFDTKVAQKEFDALKKEYESIFNLESNKPFEWRFAFPEVLDNNGDFLGFDLVIGNPPYIRQEEIKHLKPQLQKTFSIYKGTSDIYTYFYEQGYKILSPNGTLSFITSNKWCRAAYGEPLREFLLKNTQINTYLDLNGVKVFESAMVDTSILEFHKVKADASHSLNYANPKDYNPKENKPLEESLELTQIPQDSLSTDSFIFTSPEVAALKAKIESIGTPLKDWDINIYRGILTGYNEAFIIDTAKREEILKACKDENERARTAQLIKPILRGRDIKRYSYEWAGLWIIGTFPALKLDIDEYPAVKSYLESFMPRIAQSGEKGCRKKTSNKWFETQDNIAYYNEFAKPKIVYSEIVREPQFYLDNGEFKFGHFYAEATSFILTANCHSELSQKSEESLNDSKKDISGKSPQYDKMQASLEYLLGLLHSKLCTFAFKEFYAGGGLGESGYRYKKAFLENLPIPKITQSQEVEFIAIMREIIECKKSLGAKGNKNTRSLRGAEIVEKGGSSASARLELEANKRGSPLDCQKSGVFFGAKGSVEGINPFLREEKDSNNKEELQDLESRLDSLESKLDSMVFSLYGLSNEEIELISNGGGQNNIV